MVGLVEHAADEEKYLSPITLVESRSAIRRRERSGEVTAPQAQSALSALAEELRRIALQPLTTMTFVECERVLDAHALRTLDALQLSTALLLKKEYAGAKALRFVCSDQRLLQAAAEEGLEVWNPEQP